MGASEEWNYGDEGRGRSAADADLIWFLDKNKANEEMRNNFYWFGF